MAWVRDTGTNGVGTVPMKSVQILRREGEGANFELGERKRDFCVLVRLFVWLSVFFVCVFFCCFFLLLLLLGHDMRVGKRKRGRRVMTRIFT